MKITYPLNKVHNVDFGDDINGLGCLKIFSLTASRIIAEISSIASLPFFALFVLHTRGPRLCKRNWY